MYTEAMDILEHQIKPLKRVPGVVLEQSYLNRMMEGLKPLQVLGTTSRKLQNRKRGEGGGGGGGGAFHKTCHQ